MNLRPMVFEPTESMSFSKSSLAAHRAISAIYLMVSNIYLYRFMHLNIDQITFYQSQFINKANVNRGSRNGMTCILPQNALRRDCNDKYIELIEGHYLEVVVEV